MKLLYWDTFEANWHDIFITRKWIGLDFNDKNQPEQLSAPKDMQFHYSRDCYGIVFFQTTLLAAGINCILSGTSMLRRKWAFWTGMHLILMQHHSAWDTFIKTSKFINHQRLRFHEQLINFCGKASSTHTHTKAVCQIMPNSFTLCRLQCELGFIATALKPATLRGETFTVLNYRFKSAIESEPFLEPVH